MRLLQRRILTASGRENRPHRSRTAPAQRNRFSSLSLMHIPPAQGPAAQMCSRALYGQIRFSRSVDADVRHGVDGRVAAHADAVARLRAVERAAAAAGNGKAVAAIDLHTPLERALLEHRAVRSLRHGRTFFPHNIVRCVWQAANFSAKQQKRTNRGIPADAPVFPCIGFNFPSGSAAYPRADTP